ncbi:anaphase-promoting complex, cyclosome, subunit 4-domain-containing protein [Daedaleopsis nitida]|nr:anaphase-promoting complex, cyclosome, subunit 4-domain-containing protein [Daedaleopsis nitida]
MSTTIAPVATIQLPSASRVLHASWCPDKDLVVVISRAAHQEKMILYKMQGGKKWEVVIQPSNVGKVQTEVTGVAWSPDVQSIAVVSNPAMVTIHSIQNGAVERSIPITDDRRIELKGVWWFREEKKVIGNGLPDIFKRGDNITGSAHAILKGLPLLDPIQDDTKPLTSSELFAFQGARNKTVQQATLPDSILGWPALPLDLAASSIASNKPDAQTTVPEAEDEADDTNVNSILAVADSLGFLRLFLEGSYPLGMVLTQRKTFSRSLYKLRDHFFSHTGPSSPLSDGAVGLLPHVVQSPYLTGRHLRDVARVSSSARDLLGYTIRVVKDMREAWFGSEAQVGARDLGPKWIQSLEARQSSAFGQEEPFALLDLTCLLTTGRTSESLMDFLGSAEHMSDRSIQKWDTVMCDTLIRLRDLSEKRVAPACQRLHLLLQDVQGWAALPQYAVCNFKPADIEACLEYTATAIFQASWLASFARKELLRFKEFMKWIRYETARANATGDQHNTRPQHDILEVNEYLASSLVVSPIDKWFMGPGARINREGLGVPSENASIKTAIAKARAALDHWDQTVQNDVKPRDLSHVERNLDALVHTLAGRCQQMFEEASKAAARSAIRVAGWEAAPTDVPDNPGPDGGSSSSVPLIRERTVEDGSKPDSFLQYLAIRPPHDGGRSYLCIARLEQGLGALTSVPAVEVSVLECCTLEEGSEEPQPFDLLDVDFFDSELLVMVYRLKDQKTACIATTGYANLIYHAIPSHEYVTGTTRERLMGDVLGRVRSGEVSTGGLAETIIQSRTLSGSWAGGVSLAVNGRAGRRVSCVLDSGGVTLEVVDMAGEAEEAEEAESGVEAQ